MTQFLLAKSIAEGLFVAALAVAFAYSAFPPFFRGSVDLADAHGVAGWVVDAARPSAHVEVQLYIDDHFAGSVAADRARPDVFERKRAPDISHGFVFVVPPLPPGEHEARVYAVHESGGGARRTLQLLGKPLRFEVKAPETSLKTSQAWRQQEKRDS